MNRSLLSHLGYDFRRRGYYERRLEIEVQNACLYSDVCTRAVEFFEQVDARALHGYQLMEDILREAERFCDRGEPVPVDLQLRFANYDAGFHRFPASCLRARGIEAEYPVSFDEILVLGDQSPRELRATLAEHDAIRQTMSRIIRVRIEDDGRELTQAEFNAIEKMYREHVFRIAYDFHDRRGTVLAFLLGWGGDVNPIWRPPSEWN